MNTNNDTVLCLPCHWVMPCKKHELKISWKKFLKFPLLTTISAINFLCLNNYQKILNSPHIFQNCVVEFFPGQKQLCNVISSSKHECIFFSHILQQKVRWMTVVDIYTFSHFAWPGAGRSRDPPPASVLPPAVPVQCGHP